MIRPRVAKPSGKNKPDWKPVMASINDASIITRPIIISRILLNIVWPSKVWLLDAHKFSDDAIGNRDQCIFVGLNVMNVIHRQCIRRMVNYMLNAPRHFVVNPIVRFVYVVECMCVLFDMLSNDKGHERCVCICVCVCIRPHVFYSMI